MSKQFKHFGKFGRVPSYLTVILFSLSYSLTATVTKDLLLQLFSHSMEFKIWDTKDKVSPRARFDRPKAFRLPGLRGPDDPESSNIGGVQQMIVKQQQSYASAQPKQSRTSAKGDKK